MHSFIPLVTSESSPRTFISDHTRCFIGCTHIPLSSCCFGVRVFHLVGLDFKSVVVVTPSTSRILPIKTAQYSGSASATVFVYQRSPELASSQGQANGLVREAGSVLFLRCEKRDSAARSSPCCVYSSNTVRC